MKKKEILNLRLAQQTTPHKNQKNYFLCQDLELGGIKPKDRMLSQTLLGQKKFLTISFDNEDEGITQVVLSSISGTIKENLKSLLKKLSDARSTKQ